MYGYFIFKKSRVNFVFFNVKNSKIKIFVTISLLKKRKAPNPLWFESFWSTRSRGISFLIEFNYIFLYQLFISHLFFRIFPN